MNVDMLKKEITRFLECFVEASFSVKINNESMSLVSKLFSQVHVQNVNYEGDTVKVVFRAIPWFVDRIKGKIKHLGGEFKSEGEIEEGDGVAKSCCS